MTAQPGPPGSFFYVLEDPVRILFVDDDPILREFAAVHLATDKAEVLVSPDGIDALKVVQRVEVDVVLLDLDMPGMDGLELLGRLRSDERTRRTPVIALTGREDAAVIDAAFEVGATAFLIKPINWRLLSYEIRCAHQTAEREKLLIRQRTEARRQAHRAGEALRRVALEGAPLLREAMQGPPNLRRMAEDYLAVLESAMGAPPIEGGS